MSTLFRFLYRNQSDQRESGAVPITAGQTGAADPETRPPGLNTPPIRVPECSPEGRRTSPLCVCVQAALCRCDQQQLLVLQAEARRGASTRTELEILCRDVQTHCRRLWVSSSMPTQVR